MQMNNMPGTSTMPEMNNMPDMQMNTTAGMRNMPGMSNMPGMNTNANENPAGMVDVPPLRGAASVSPAAKEMGGPGDITSGQSNSGMPGLTLPELQKMALEHNPTLVQAKAQVEGEKGKARQAGIWPNPMAGYTGDLMGLPAAGAGEWQGGSLAQEIILGGKLRLSRAKYKARAEAAEHQQKAQQLKVANDVQMHFYRTLAAGERLKMQNELQKSMRDRWLTVGEMFNVGEASEADRQLANANIAEQRLKVLEAKNDLQYAWENLITAVGVNMAYRPLQGSLEGSAESIANKLQWEPLLQKLIDQSPQMGEARAKLKSDEITLHREKVQKIPNVEIGGGYGYDQLDKGGAARATLNVTNIPVFNRNQGTVQQAEADLSRQRAQVKLLELQLRRQLADEYRHYLTALQHVETYKNDILPALSKRYQLMLKSYQNLRTDWPAVLETQRDFFSQRLAYIDHLQHWRESEISLSGFLLTGALVPPPGITPPGHIDATPQPR